MTKKKRQYTATVKFTAMVEVRLAPVENLTGAAGAAVNDIEQLDIIRALSTGVNNILDSEFSVVSVSTGEWLD